MARASRSRREALCFLKQKGWIEMKKTVKKLVLSRETLGSLTGAGQQQVVLARSENSWCPSCESCTGACCPPYPY